MGSGSLSHRLTMCADVWRDVDRQLDSDEISFNDAFGNQEFGSETLQARPHISDLPCFVTVEPGNRQRRSATEMDTAIVYLVMLTEMGTDIRVTDCVGNVRREGAPLFGEQMEVVAVLPHAGFAYQFTTELVECHLRLIGI